MLQTTHLQDHPGMENDISSLINDLLKEKNSTCVSVIVSTHRLGQERQGDKKEIQHAVLAAKEAVSEEPGDLSLKIDDLFQQVDFKRSKEGIGFFVSSNIKKLVKFPFPVTKKMIINRRFHFHDLVYLENYSSIYYLLDISKKEILLFRGMMDQLEEINNENFPRKITDDYEYNKSSQSTSYAGYAHVKGFEKDKSEIQQIRIQKIFRETDKYLQPYFVTKDTPLILCGPERDVSLFKSVTSYSDNIIISISDNHYGTDLHDLSILAWLQVKSLIDQQKFKLIDEFKEKVGNKLAVYGLEGVWEAAKEGKGLKLIVEKDYGKTAFVTQDSKLQIHYPPEKYVRYPDVVNEIIATVLEKNGKVIIVEKDALRDYGQIALINRY